MGMKAKDLAKKLGVSPATISLVLNNKPGISDSLRKSLLEQIQALGHEDMLCESCREGEAPGRNASPQKRMDAIAYLSYLECEDQDISYFFPGVLEGAEVEARENGFYFSVLHRKCYPDVPLEELLRRRGNIVGAIIQTDDVTEDILQETSKIDIPFVFMDVYNPAKSLYTVRVNNFSSMHRIISYLKNRGHREIGYVYSGWELDWQKNRRTGFSCVLSDLGLEDRPENYFCAQIGGDIYEYQRLADLFRSREKLPTALVCENDRQAMRTINALHQIGLRVPEDVSVVGFDNTALSKMTNPKLTTVRNSSHLMGRECVALLQNILRLKKLGIKLSHLAYELPTELVERDSVCDGPCGPAE